MGNVTVSHNFSIEAQYLFGMAHISEEKPFWNKLDPNGCFPGVRLQLDTDVVAKLRQFGMTEYPKMKLLYVHTAVHGKYDLLDCSTPEITHIPPPMIWWGQAFLIKFHSLHAFLPQLQNF